MLRKADARKFLKSFNVLEISPEITKKAMLSSSQYEFGKSKTIDYLIGATAAVYKMPLATANIRDFVNLPGIKLIPYSLE